MSTLQDLLNLGLVDIGSDDSRFAKMEAAAAGLVAHLASEPALIIPAALIAIDCDADEDEPIFVLVEEKMIEHWNTMRNTHVNRPRELLRSVIIHALSLLATENPEIAALIWHTAIGPINHRQARLGKEAAVVTDLLQMLGKQAEDEAVARTRLVSPTPKSKRRSKQGGEAPIKFSLKSSVPLKDDEILTDVARSVGPQQPSGEAMDDPNPHAPNVDPSWSTEFTPRMATALVKAVNLGAQRAATQLRGSLQSYAEAFEQRLANHLRHVETIRAEVLGAQQAAQIRLEVLWWSEAKFSPSLMRGYRGMPQATAVVAMAHDLTQIVPAMAPTSVSYVLGEAVAALSGLKASSSPQSVEALLYDLHANGSELRGLIPNITTNSQRAPLFGLIAEAVGGSEITPTKIRDKTGVDPALELALPDFAMWTFHDMQAFRLVEMLK